MFPGQTAGMCSRVESTEVNARYSEFHNHLWSRESLFVQASGHQINHIQIISIVYVLTELLFHEQRGMQPAGLHLHVVKEEILPAWLSAGALILGLRIMDQNQVLLRAHPY